MSNGYVRKLLSTRNINNEYTSVVNEMVGAQTHVIIGFIFTVLLLYLIVMLSLRCLVTAVYFVMTVK